MMGDATTQLVGTTMFVGGVRVGIGFRNVGNLDRNGGMLMERKEKKPARNAGKAVRQEEDHRHVFNLGLLIDGIK